MSDNFKKNMLLCTVGDSHFDEVKNRFILETTITYIKDSERFSGSLFDLQIYKQCTPAIKPPTSYLYVYLLTLAMYFSLLIFPRQD